LGDGGYRLHEWALGTDTDQTEHHAQALDRLSERDDAQTKRPSEETASAFGRLRPVAYCSMATRFLVASRMARQHRSGAS
jgi:hypothetical protein